MKIHNKKELEYRRKKLRNDSTLAEIFLWKHLKQKQLNGRKFRRQHSIGNYIVDFYCPEERLVVELNGEPHFDKETKKYDKARTLYLNGLNIKVIRFENVEILRALENVLNKISSEFY
ncbi:MAG: endonuclease domain-containing protein [Ignavibacteriaceae bacterium]|jgi:very-short-patch-repair endonuclease|nr:endonuclease domain-containing protein [Chlorobium sp.]MCW8818489.1 endonuclease domain-containing protein [Ignavibacteriaceae bacterium]MCW8961808.1 endonuclease domain-containing protein [Ignavibacteriaceae bacterium]